MPILANFDKDSLYPQNLNDEKLLQKNCLGRYPGTR